MVSPHEMFHYLADAWVRDGKPAERLIANDWRLYALSHWCGSAGALKQGVSASLYEFAEASADALFEKYDWFKALTTTRDYCAGCGERYLVPNMHICSNFECLSTYCYRCVLDYSTQAPNGNRLHRCGGELVLSGS